MSNMNINFTSNASKMAKATNSLAKSMDNLGKAGRKTTGDFRSFQKQTRKVNDMFSNMARDGNRSTKVFKNLSLSTITLGKAFNLLLSYKVGAWLRQSITSAMDMIEVNELFRVSLGELTRETDMAVRKVNEFTGLDTTNLRERVANFNLLGKTMGMTAKNSQTLGLNMNQLALDMGAVFNVSYQQVAEDLRSGLVGQSRVLYKYGIDVTNAQLAEEARARGITKSVNKMSQYEKMMLRHQVILKQTTVLQGEFAHEFNFPMNQLRIFQDRFVTLSRTIGQLFLPAMGAIVKVANAVVIALNNIFKSIGAFFGIKFEDELNPRDIDFNPIDDEVTDSIDNVGGGLGNASKEAKKLKKQLAGFDELNIIQTKPIESPTAGGAGGLDNSGALDFDLSLYDGMLDMIEDKALAMSEKVTNGLKKIWDIAEPTRDALSKLWTEGLSKFGEFSMGTLSDFYNSFLVPVASWQLTDGLPRFFNIINDILNEIDWDRLRNSLDGLYTELSKLNINFGIELLDFMENVLKPLSVWTVGVGLPQFIDIISRFLSDINWTKIHSALNGLWDAISPFAINVGEGLLWFLDNVLRPIATFTINEVVPRFLELLTNAINILNGTIEALKPLGSWLMDNFLKPLGEWTGEKIIQGLDWLNNGLKTFSDWIENNQKIVEGLAIFIGSLAGAIGLVTVATKLWTAVSWLATYGTTALGLALLAITSPMVLVVAGIGAVIAVGVLLYKNWDTIKEFAGKLWEGIKKSFDDISKKVKEVWDNVKKWGIETWQTIVDTFKGVGTWFSERFKEAFNNIKSAFSTIKTWATDRWNDVKNVFSPVGTWFKTQFTTAWSNIKNAFSGAKTWASDTWNDIKEIFGKVPDWFKDQFTKAWTNVKNVFSTGGKIFDGIKEGIASTFKTVVNGLINGINRVIKVPFDAINGMLNKIRNTSVLGFEPFSGLWSRNPLSVPQIPRLADGGILDMGQLFIAREAGAELVGNFGGRTAVMNNDDILYSVTKGVYQAVKMAMSGMGGDGEPIQIEINILGDTVMDKVIPAIKRENRKNNKLVIDVD